MTRQQNGNFVSSVFGEDRGRGWAPELRGMLSVPPGADETEHERTGYVSALRAANARAQGPW